MNSFESKVLEGLCSGAKCRHLGFAVSGGADSIAMLTAAASLLKENKIAAEKLYVITVNHFIRPDSETCGDADFVLDYCRQLKDSGLPVEGFCYALEKGQVNAVAVERGGGIEDAARSLRYEKFEQFISDKNIDYLCLAHNQNDQMETLLMRFLQGSSGSAASGIQMERNKYLRPLLNISRTEIETYLTQKSISWRTDSTNNATEYLRNKIRHKLIPVLNEQFPGWQTGVLAGAEKHKDESTVVNNLIEEILPAGNTEIPVEDFCRYETGIQIPLLLRMCNSVSQNCRVPYRFLKQICCEVSEMAKNKKEICFVKRFSDLEILCKNKKIIVKKYVKTETDLIFFDIIEETGTFMFPFGVLTVTPQKKNTYRVYCNDSDCGISVPLPFCVRNAQTGDVVKTAEGTMKKVSEVFSNWKVGEEKKSLIPVLQDLSEAQKIFCILGECAGFDNWIVKE